MSPLASHDARENAAAPESAPESVAESGSGPVTGPVTGPTPGRSRRRTPADLLAALEALLLLAGFRVWLAIAPVKRICARVAHARVGKREGMQAAGDEAALDVSQRCARVTVQWAVLAIVRRAPLEFVCFPQALAGFIMLRRRGLPAALVYGVRRDDTGRLLAHTWLLCGGAIVLGAAETPQFTPIDWWV